MKITKMHVALAVSLAWVASCNSSEPTGQGQPTITTLKNDGYTSGPIAFQSGFMAGEGAGAYFPPGTAYRVQNVRFLFGGDATSRTVTLTLYAVTGGGTTRTPIHSDDYAIVPSNDSFREIDLRSEGIDVEAAEGLLVALVFQHTGLPSVAIDADGLTSGRNLVYADLTGGGPDWYPSETAGVGGDWIIRAQVEED